MERYFQRVSSYETKLWQGKTLPLGQLDIELTERCNNDCIHCCINLPSDDLSAHKQELTTDKIHSILQEAASLGCLTVRFTGGEPLLREDFEDLYVFARRLGLKVLLFTNATLITPYLADLLARMPPLEKVEISVYGMRRASYEAVTRTPGSFETAWRGISLLLEKKIPFVVKSALLPPNRREMKQFETWASTIVGMDEPPAYSLFLDLRCRLDSEEKNQLIKGLRLTPEEQLQVLTRKREEYIKNMREFCAKFIGPRGEKLLFCGAGVGNGCVDAYGSFQLCMILRHPSTVYDLKRGSLEDALTNFFPKVREMTAKSPGYLARCARCFLIGLCEQCPARSWTEHGALDTPVEHLCRIAHNEARFLGLLEKDEKAWEITDWRERIESMQ